MHGWTGNILKIDLTEGKAWRETIPTEILHAYLGGRGLGVRLMRDYFDLDPFDPKMPLIFAVGPLCGVPAPTSARLSVVSRSPLTGTVTDCSAGGRFAWRLKGAGLDAVFIQGKSPRPVAITVDEERVELIDAADLWGTTVDEAVKRFSDRGSVAAIGPAGENGVLFASIIME